MPAPDSETRIAAAAFRILAHESWSRVSLASVARAAKVSWKEMQQTAPSRTALVRVMLSRTAADTAKHFRPDRIAQKAHERVFDAIMSWFETQNPRKDAVRSLYDGLRRDPLALVSLRADFVASVEWLLALAEADAGTLASVRVACIGAIVARALPVWLADDEGMGKTMARLDRDLRRIDRFIWEPEQPRAKPQRKRRSR